MTVEQSIQLERLKAKSGLRSPLVLLDRRPLVDYVADFPDRQQLGFLASLGLTQVASAIAPARMMSRRFSQ